MPSTLSVTHLPFPCTQTKQDVEFVSIIPCMRLKCLCVCVCVWDTRGSASDGIAECNSAGAASRHRPGCDFISVCARGALKGRPHSDRPWQCSPRLIKAPRPSDGLKIKPDCKRTMTNTNQVRESHWTVNYTSNKWQGEKKATSGPGTKVSRNNRLQWASREGRWWRHGKRKPRLDGREPEKIYKQVISEGADEKQGCKRRGKKKRRSVKSSCQRDLSLEKGQRARMMSEGIKLRRIIFVV